MSGRYLLGRKRSKAEKSSEGRLSGFYQERDGKRRKTDLLNLLRACCMLERRAIA